MSKLHSLAPRGSRRDHEPVVEGPIRRYRCNKVLSNPVHGPDAQPEKPWGGSLHEPCSSGRESAHSSLEKFEPTHVGCYEPVRVHKSQCMRKNERGFSMNHPFVLVAILVRVLD